MPDNNTTSIVFGVTSVCLILAIIYLFFKLKNYQTQTEILKIEIEQIELNHSQRIEIEKQKNELNLNSKIQELEAINSLKSINLQERIIEKESYLKGKVDELESQKLKMETDRQSINEDKLELKESLNNINKEKLKIQEEHIINLERISKMSKLEAKELLFSEIIVEDKEDILIWQNKYFENIQSQAQAKAAEIVSLAIQRCSSEVANEQTITNIKLQDDSDKGKIIGRNGRNLLWLEKTLGVEFIIDDNAEGVITISGFSSLRRHIAKKTLTKLLEDGRIHPASIEEMYEKSKAEIATEIAEAGEWACSELGIFDFNAKLIRIIGRLKFRTSYGQNMLKHAVEMAKLAKNMAIEMNSTFSHRVPVDVDICVKGALLHDIGKAMDEETLPKGNHIDLGEKICDMFELDWRIRKCVSSHHNESYYDKDKGFCIEAVLVDACDNISGGRPGARKETVELYYNRMEQLEEIANQTEGVIKSWIMRGSRELWVFFDSRTVDSLKMRKSAKSISDKIKATVSYPGEIKIVGILEDKVVQYAK
jgi:ribonucrease Y